MVEVQPGDQVYTDRWPRRVQLPESEITDQLTECSYILEEMFTNGSSKVLPRTMRPYIVRFATENTVTFNNHEVIIPVILDRVTKIPRALNSPEHTAGLRSTAGRPRSDMQKDRGESTSPSADLKHLGPVEYVTERAVGHRGAADKREHKAQWYGYSAERDSYEAASGLLNKVFRRNWATRRRHEVAKPKQTGEGTLSQQKIEKGSLFRLTASGRQVAPIRYRLTVFTFYLTNLYELQLRGCVAGLQRTSFLY